MPCVSRSNFHLLSLGKPIDSHWFKMSYLNCLIFSCVYCFFLKRWSYTKICSAWTSRTSAEIFFLTDWRHKRLKNTIDLLLFYREHFYEFSESVLMITRPTRYWIKKKIRENFPMELVICFCFTCSNILESIKRKFYLSF